jgi:phage-related protein
MKPIVFMGDSLERIRKFSDQPRREMGFQLDRVQRGLNPDDWKPMATVGPGVREIRVRDTTGAYRAIYIASFVDAVYVLHAFQKKTSRTPQTDISVAEARLRMLRRGSR